MVPVSFGEILLTTERTCLSVTDFFSSITSLAKVYGLVNMFPSLIAA